MRYGRSGDYRIDSLLKGYYWQDAIRKPVELTFSIRSQGKNALNNEQRWMVLDALQQWSSVANIDFKPVTNGGHLRFSLQDGGGGNANYNRDVKWWQPGTWRTSHLNHVNVTIGKDEITGKGERFLGVAIHEIGHALGLKHPGNYNGDGTGDGPFLPYREDNRANSVMTYNSSFFRKSDGAEKGLVRLSPMPYDILAAQYLYGARQSNSGNTNYQFYNITRYHDGLRLHGSDKLKYMFLSLWDSGGIDTIDLSKIIPDRPNHDNGYRIDINDGGAITFKDYYKSGRYRPLDNGKDVGSRLYDLTPAGTFIAHGANIENVIGSQKSDSIFGNSLNNRIDGLDGNDFIYGGGGTDRLYGGNGNDHLRGQAGRDYLNGGHGDDYLDGGHDHDVLHGADGKDRLYGYDDDDTLNGGNGDDYLYGGRGNDYLYGNNDDDRLRGESGADYLYGWHGEDRLYGGTANDYLHGGTGSDFLFGESGDDELHGGSGDDTLEGGSGNDKLFGWNDNDSLTPGVGNDEVYGGWGDDKITIWYFNENDFVDGGFGHDTLELRPFDNRSFKIDFANGLVSDNLPGQQTFQNIERIITGSGNDFIQGDADNNYLESSGGNDKLFGGDGQDRFSPGSGNDEVHGEAGDDTIYIYNFNDIDILHGGEGIDTLILNPIDNRVLDVSLERGDIKDNQPGKQVFTSVENVSTGHGNDLIRGDAADNHLYGDAGNDAVIGAEGNDSVIGGDGDDLLIGDSTATYNGHQYLMTDRMTLQAAQNLAETLGGNLITINDANEQQWLTQTFGQHGLLWIGLTDSVSEGNWQWVSGETTAYQNWSPGEPNDWETGEDYALTGWGQSQWNDVPENWTERGIIEIAHLAPVFEGGNDRLEGGHGNDRLYGGSGNDMLTPGSGDDFVFGEAGNDTVKVYDFNGTDSLDGGSGDDILLLAPIDNRDLNVDVNRGTILDSRVGLQTFENFERIITGAGNDLLRGDESHNQLEAGDGNDTLYGGAGDDFLSPGKGNDIVYGEAGDDTISINDFDGMKTIDGGEGSDTLVLFPPDFRNLDVNLERGSILDGQSGEQQFKNIENIVTVDGNDTIRGNDVSNRLDSGFGDDTLTGAGGNDKLLGGAGNDVLSGGSGRDSYDGGDGIDTVDFSSEAANIRADLTNQNVVIGSGQPTEIVEDLKNIENVIGTQFADRLTGNATDNRIEGRAGNDSIFGRKGDDVLVGGEGNDGIRGNEGNDTLQGNDGQDDLRGNEGDDTIIGGTGNDYLEGNEGNDYIEGGIGRDRIAGHEGDDILLGGAGDDTIYVSEGADQIDGEAGNDLIALYGLTYGVEADLSQQTLAKTDGTLLLTTIKSIERATGTQFDDRLISHQAGSSLWGLEGNDIIEGSASRDSLRGNEGDDILIGGYGDDFLSGNEGNDRLEGGSGNDRLSGHGGDNILLGGDGNDGLYIEDGANYVDGGAGSDYISLKDLAFGVQVNLAQQTLADANGNALPSTIRSIEHARGSQFDDLLIGDDGNNSLWANSGNDTIKGGAGNDNLRGHAGDDILFGGVGNDGLQGNLGNDILNGNAGNDSLFGNEGDDILAGGTGNDRLEGGEGADTFILGVDLGQDTIIDFELGIDRIGLQDTLSFGQLSLTQTNSDTQISVGDELLATVQEINVNTLTSASFTDNFATV